MEKIFGEFNSTEDLNRTAENLKENKEYDELLILGKENGIDEERIKKFYESEETELIEKSEKEIAVEELPTNETAIEKLQREVKSVPNKIVPVGPIVKFLTAECERDADLGNLILIPHKTLEKCCSYVEKKARSKISGSSGWIADDEVYSWAREYYLLDDAEIEKAEAEKRKKEEAERKKRAEEAKKNKPAEVKKEDNKQKTPVKKPKEKDDSQLSLFDFGGTDE